MKLKTIFLTLILTAGVLTGCGNNSAPSTPPAVPTVSGLPAEEPTRAPDTDVPPEGYPEMPVMPTTESGAYPAPPVMPTLEGGAYPAPSQ